MKREVSLDSTLRSVLLVCTALLNLATRQISALESFMSCKFLRHLRPAICVFAALTVSSAMAQDIQKIPAQEAQLQIIRQVPIAAEVAGALVEVNPTEEGVFVKKGDLLIKLNDSVILAEVERARKQAALVTEIEFAEVALETALENQKQKQEANKKRAGAFTPSEMRQVDLEVRKGEAQLSKAKEDKVLHELDLKTKEAQLNQYTVYAPFDGFVTKVLKYAGQNVRPGDPVLTLTDMSELRASLKIHYKYRDQLFVGDEVEIRINTQAQAAPAPQQAAGQQAESDLGIIFGGDDKPPAGKGGPRADAEAFADEPIVAAGSGEVFVGKITVIDPKVEPDSSQALMIRLGVTVPNSQDEYGRFMLQEGMPVKAVVLAKKRK